MAIGGKRGRSASITLPESCTKHSRSSPVPFREQELDDGDAGSECALILAPSSPSWSPAAPARGLAAAETPRRRFPSPLQRGGGLHDVFGAVVLGTHGFCYSIDAGNCGLRDGASEVRRSSLRAAALVCSAWHGLCAATLEWERQRHADEARALLDARVQPLVCGAHLAPCARSAVWDAARAPPAERAAWLDPPRLALLPFKEGDVLLVDAAKLAAHCDRLAAECPDVAPLVKAAADAHRLVGELGKFAAADAAPAFGGDPRELARRRALERTCRGLARVRVTRLAAVALPRLRADGRGWAPARGPGGRVLVEVGAHSLRGDAVAERVAPRDLAAPNVEALLPAEAAGDAALLRGADRAGPWTSSLPLPLLEPGVVRRVVPADYEAPRLDWPAPGGGEVPKGASLCAIRGRPQVVLGCAREAREAPGGGLREAVTLFVRDAADGRSATAEAGTWGMDEWTRGDLDVFDEPRPPVLGVGADMAAPPSLAHLLLDCRDGKHEIATRAGLLRA